MLHLKVTRKAPDTVKVADSRERKAQTQNEQPRKVFPDSPLQALTKKINAGAKLNIRQVVLAR